MNQDLITLVRSKNLPNEEMFEVFAVLRRDNIVEGLIDYIADTIHDDIKRDNDEIDGLRCELEQVRQELELCENERDELQERDYNENLKAENLSTFLENFENENDRHPSIEEVWEAAWNGCYEKVKKEEKR